MTLGFTNEATAEPALKVGERVLWRPNPGPQTMLVTCPVFEVFYGGARGGGKTEGSIGDWLLHAEAYGENASGIFFRRTLLQLDDVIKRTRRMFSKVGARYNVQQKEWVFPNGARLKFRYLEKDADAEEYQGHEYTRVYVEEVTNFPSPKPIMLLLGTVRSSAGVPCGMRLTGNPGGPGHSWVKKRYIDPDKRGYRVIKEQVDIPDYDGPPLVLERVFIPAKLADNEPLTKNDPMYIARLANVGSKQLVRAWLTGDWDIAVGAYFTQFDRRKHVLPDRILQHLPPWLLCFASFDWGYAKPFSVGWYVVSDGSFGLPRGAILKVAEWYGTNGRPNEGLRLDAREVATGMTIREAKLPFKVAYRVADPSIFVRDGGPSIAENFAIGDIHFRRGDNRRLSGWNQLRQCLNGPESTGIPMFYVLEGCQFTIEQFESVPADKDNPDDVDTAAEDHAMDETRYGIMSRAEPADRDPEQTGPKTLDQMTLNELWQDAEAYRPEARIQ